MHRQLEPFRQEALQHTSDIIPRRVSALRFGRDIELIGVGPARSSDNSDTLDPVSQSYDLPEFGSFDSQPLMIDDQRHHVRPGRRVHRFHRCHLKAGHLSGYSQSGKPWRHDVNQYTVPRNRRNSQDPISLDAAVPLTFHL
jgi:hypothetical protein